MNEVKRNETIENIIMALVLTGILPFIACVVLIGLAGWILL